MTWFSDQRQAWIAEALAIFGFINRAHLCRKFGISVPQAALDLRRFCDENPGAMRYDPRRKAYIATSGPAADCGANCGASPQPDHAGP